MKVDRNEDYGFYYTEGGKRIDQGVVEIVDTNDNYGEIQLKIQLTKYTLYSNDYCYYRTRVRSLAMLVTH